MSHVLSGRDTHRSTYARASWLFLRLLGVVYLIAVWSFGMQVRGLIGHDGILPAGEFMTAVRQYADAQQLGLERFRIAPTLLWLGTSDRFLETLCVAGVLLALLLVAGFVPFIVLPLLWLDYLSLVVVSRDFLSYQWDTLLLEAGSLAILIAPLTLHERFTFGGEKAEPRPLARWLLWWLVFRLMFGSGIVKLASGDPTWRGLTALAVHYETQPIPTPVAWYAHQLPLSFQTLSTGAVLGIEFGAPWLIFGPRRLRIAGCLVLIALQGVIALTGNYAFFNLLSIALCLLLLDDEALEGASAAMRGRWPWKAAGHASASVHAGGGAPSAAAALVTPGGVPAPVEKSWAGGRGRGGKRWPRWVVVVAAILTVPVSVVTLAGQAGFRLPGSAAVVPLQTLIAPFASVNPYGLFAVMTTTRPEIIVEGSNDGVTWLPYEFAYKAGDPRRRPPWVAPHQPRLDWQMWFAALGRFEQEDWFQSFCRRLLDGSPDVVGLLEGNPFPQKPPRFVRAVLYQYHFADLATHRTQGVWWVRQELGPYSPVLSPFR